MIETDRVLRPLREAEPAIGQLDTYESPAALTEALRATWHAVDRTLRTLLRSDATAPDSIRLTAMSPGQMSADSVMTELRRRDLVSLHLAGRVHELRHAVERAEQGSVRAADADHALETVRALTEEVHGAARRATNVAAEPAPAESTRDARVEPRAAGAKEDAQRSGQRWSREEARPVVLIAVMVVLVTAAALAVFLFSDGSELERGIAAFSDGRAQAAEQHFRAALEQDDGDNTARLYLARMLRRDSRHEEAGALLREAVARDSADAAIRREFGYLFLDLERPDFATGQFRRAVELDPADAVNWAALVQSLRQSGDSAGASEWLRRAPAEAREMVR
jgi:tetratricopeptide (TPR) repeat protein